jgi:uncharacterized protein
MPDLPPSGFLPGKHAIDSYGRGGFRFAGISHRGSILALPSGIRSWSPETPADIDLASLTAVFEEPDGSIEYLLLGMGKEPCPLAPEILQRFRTAGIRIEAMSTGAAGNTYSLLLREDRLVAAALLAVP